MAVWLWPGPVASDFKNFERQPTGDKKYRAAGRAADVRQYQQGARQTARACVVRACVRACVTTSQLKFLGGHIRGPGRPISHTKPPGITHQTPKRKEEVENKTKALFDLFELTSPPPSTCPMPHHRLGRPNPPPLAHPAPTRRFWMRQRSKEKGVPCRSTPSTSALNHTSHPHIRYPATLPLFSSLRRFALQGNERPGVITQRMGMHIGTRITHVSLTNTEQLLGDKKHDFPILA
jgi:hypothetical protein